MSSFLLLVCCRLRCTAIFRHALHTEMKRLGGSSLFLFLPIVSGVDVWSFLGCSVFRLAVVAGWGDGDDSVQGAVFARTE